MMFNFGDNMKLEVNEAKRLLQTSHSALVFFDRGGTKPLPPREFLARFQIVITTIQRFSNEWKNGSFEQDARRSEGNEIPWYFEGLQASQKNVCSLLKIHWHRMVIDEGHSMAKGHENSSIQFASWIHAERRWAMTGTPTKHNTMQLNQVKALLRFLRHDFFVSKGDGDQFWKKEIMDRWKGKDLVSFYRLRSLLMLLMRRHTKLDIEELPFPSFQKEIIPMSEIEVNTYNTLVSAVQSNILLTSMVGKTSGKQDSLLHRKNARHAREALENVRRVCIGWSRVVPVLTDKNWRETIELAELHNLDLVPVREFMHAAESEGLSFCSICHLGLTTLLLPSCCGRLICTECFDNQSTTCIACGDDFDVDDFQRLQPGFTMTWRSNLKDPERTSQPETPDHQLLPRAIQPGARAGMNIANPIPPRRTNKFGDGHICEYRDKESMTFARNNRCLLCWEEHNACNLMNEDRRCGACGRTATDCPEDESKSYYLINKLAALHSHSTHQRPLKVIVFSQFRKALNVVGDRLYRRFGSACIAEYWGRYRKEELSKFIHHSECVCLLLTKDGSEGLDLSFVTHIFLLEEIWDKALEDQVVARAWRMGARGRVEVETLVAQHSVEEIMMDVKAEEQEGPKEELSALDKERKKLHSLLLALRLNTDYQRLGNGSEKTKSKSKANAFAFDGPASWKKRKRIDGSSLEPSEMGSTRKKRVTFQLPL
jgi:SNF2 family DNA or RNA helicase